MKLVEIQEKQSTVILSEEELYIIRSIVGEIYSGVCVDARDFEAIHGVQKNEVLRLKKDLYEIYDQLIDSEVNSESF